MNGENSELIYQIIKILIITMAVTGALSCIYITGGFIFSKKNGLYIKGNTYLILDIDEIGEKLEYYVRKIESDIAGRYIYISRIILYSKALGKAGGTDTADIKEAGEAYKICRILSENYDNIIFLNDGIIENGNDGNDIPALDFLRNL